MLNCEYCGKSFKKEGFLRNHVNTCKKRDKIVKEEEAVVDEIKDVVDIDIDDEYDFRLEEEIHDSPSPPKNKKKVTFKEDKKVNKRDAKRDDKRDDKHDDKRDAKHDDKRDDKRDDDEKILVAKVNAIDDRIIQVNASLNGFDNSMEQVITRLNSLDKVNTKTLKSIEQLNSVLESINEKISDLKTVLINMRDTSKDDMQRQSVKIDDYLASLTRKPEVVSETTVKEPESVVVIENKVEVYEEQECCLILATNEDRLKRRLFKICLVENWEKQQDKVKSMYHVIMEKIFDDFDDGNKTLKNIEDKFSRRRVSPNKKWYKLRDDDLEEVVELFN